MKNTANKTDFKTESNPKIGHVFAVLFWIAVWALVAGGIGNPLLLAGPLETLQTLAQALVSDGFWRSVGQTTMRIVLTGLASALVGALLGVAAANWRFVQVLLAPVLQVMKSAPVGCVVVIVLVMSGSAGALVAIVAFVTLPPMYVAVLEGSNARAGQSRTCEQVLSCAGVGRVRIFLSCTWPTMLPFLLAATKTAVGLSWKAGITAELLCVPLGSVGAAIYASKLTLDMPSLLMWTVVVMTLGWVCEKVLLALLGLTANSPRLAVKMSCRRTPPRVSPGALIFEDVAFAYRYAMVLEGVSLVVPPGERVCLMAPTGAGKTTLISLAIRENRSQKGTVCAPALLGVVAQTDALVEVLTPLENVQLVSGSEISVDQLEREMGALLPAGTLDRAVSELSGGTRRLVQIARALYSPGKALVMDEPLTGLDVKTNKSACAFILSHQNGRPLLLTTHHAEDAQRLDARVVALDSRGNN